MAHRSWSWLAILAVLITTPAAAVPPAPPADPPPPFTLTEDIVDRFVACLPAVLEAEERVERLQRQQLPSRGPPDIVSLHRIRTDLIDQHVGRAVAVCSFESVHEWQRTRAAIRAAFARGDPLVMSRAQHLVRLEY